MRNRGPESWIPSVHCCSVVKEYACKISKCHSLYEAAIKPCDHKHTAAAGSSAASLAANEGGGNEGRRTAGTTTALPKIKGDSVS